VGDVEIKENKARGIAFYVSSVIAVDILEDLAGRHKLFYYGI
jgi:hypothetical protein